MMTPEPPPEPPGARTWIETTLGSSWLATSPTSLSWASEAWLGEPLDSSWPPLRLDVVSEEPDSSSSRKVTVAAPAPPPMIAPTASVARNVAVRRFFAGGVGCVAEGAANVEPSQPPCPPNDAPEAPGGGGDPPCA